MDYIKKTVYPLTKVKDDEGWLLRWGTYYEVDENNSRLGQYTTALVEMDDGSVKVVPADMIQFVNPTSLYGRSGN